MYGINESAADIERAWEILQQEAKVKYRPSVKVKSYPLKGTDILVEEAEIGKSRGRARILRVDSGKLLYDTEETTHSTMRARLSKAVFAQEKIEEARKARQ